MAVPTHLQYEAQFPLYGIAFSHSSLHPHRIALTSAITGPTNKLAVIDASSNSALGDYQALAQANLGFPTTKVAWEPKESLPISLGDESAGGRGELLATTGDVLRIWEVGSGYEEDGGGFVGRGWMNGSRGGGYGLTTRSVLTNSKSAPMSLPPITSFSWNPASPNSIVTCSIDTTATLWDINTSQALTQLIAHDRAVYDLSWLPQSSDIFVSVGADGSLRAFDLRTLEHSTILYESVNETPLARIAFSNREQHMLACFGLDESKVLILDMRSPGQPVAELVGHQAPLGAIAWGNGGTSTGPSGGGWLASCGDDCQLLLYDMTEPFPPDAPAATSPSTLSANPKPARPSKPSPNSALSPPVTPAQGRGSQSPSQAMEMLPVKAWTADAEVNNLAFSDDGQWVGCVSGSRLSVLSV